MVTSDRQAVAVPYRESRALAVLVESVAVEDPAGPHPADSSWPHFRSLSQPDSRSGAGKCLIVALTSS